MPPPSLTSRRRSAALRVVPDPAPELATLELAATFDRRLEAVALELEAIAVEAGARGLCALEAACELAGQEFAAWLETRPGGRIA